MENDLYRSTIQRFLLEIYELLEAAESNVIENRFDISKLKSFNELRKSEIFDFLSNFEFIKLKKDCVIVNKVQFIIDCIKFLDLDIKKFSEILDYKGFEAIVFEILVRNGYQAIKNFRFTDHSNFKSETKQKRYEIDVIGICGKNILLVDAKQWFRKDSYGALNKAANMQCQRVEALKNNPDAFSKIISQVLGVRFNAQKALPLLLIPVLVTLEDNTSRLNENQVPLVSIQSFNAFLQELELYIHDYKIFEIKSVNVQKKLF